MMHQAAAYPAEGCPKMCGELERESTAFLLLLGTGLAKSLFQSGKRRCALVWGAPRQTVTRPLQCVLELRSAKQIIKLSAFQCARTRMVRSA